MTDDAMPRTAMPRLDDVAARVLRREPKHALFRRFGADFGDKPIKAKVFAEIEQVLAAVPDADWDVFAGDLARKYLEPRRQRRPNTFDPRGYQAAMDKINEARACGWLIASGFDDVRFIPPPPKRVTKTPDLGASLAGAPVCCEVKTIDVSDAEAERRIAGGVDRSESAASAALLEKIRKAFATAMTQIRTYDADCLAIVYLFLNTDDLLGEHVEAIAAQVRSDLATHVTDGRTRIHVDFHPPFYFATR